MSNIFKGGKYAGKSIKEVADVNIDYLKFIFSAPKTRRYYTQDFNNEVTDVMNEKGYVLINDKWTHKSKI